MLKKFAVIIFTLACFTTFLTIQQTSRYHLSMKMTAIDARIRRQRAIHTDTKLTHKSGMAMEKSSSNSNNARQIDKLVQKYYNNLFATDEYKAVGPKKRKPDMNNLLIPFLFYNMGPNNLFRIFKESIPIIHMMNRTLVVPPFHHHPRMKRLNEEDQSDKTVEVDVDIFDQTYRSFVETDAKKTVDMKTLQYIIPAIPIKRFHSTCGNKINTLITCGIVSGKRASGLTHFKQVTNLTVGRVFKVEHLKDVSSDKEWKMNVMTAVQNTKGQKCVGLVLGSKCLGSRGAWFRHWRSFAPFVRHPPKIQVLANLFTENVLKGEPL
uniref:Uncharacterized protein n=1 Tax=Ciona intestinalis TaxID=7719 RepID=F6V7Z8_CIOIN